MIAPIKANPLPNKELLPLLIFPLLKAIKNPPAKDIPIPKIVSLLNFSWNKNRDSKATQIGLVVTKVVDATIEVNAKEEIQLAKCPAKQIPAMMA